MRQEEFFATCPRGLENILADEMAECGAASISQTDGGVSFNGDLTTCYKANLQSRVATRILWRVGKGGYATEEDIYKAALALDWPRWFSVGRDFMVKVTATKCPLKSLEFVTLRIKDAICDRFRQVLGSRPNIDTREPDIRVHAFLTADKYQLYIDTSGAALYQRGFRKASVEAPLRENLAAGILKLTGWKPGMPLLDPMCGSGTFLIEASMMALGLDPGHRRNFAFEKLLNYDERAWKEIRKLSAAKVKPATFQKIYGSDMDLRAVRVSRQNLQEAGLLEAVQLSHVDITNVAEPAPAGILVTNPPYGVRIGEDEMLAGLYPKIGEVLKRRFSGWTAYFLTSDLRLPKLMRLAPSKRTPLFNGPLECRLFEIRMVSGSNRREKNES